MRSLSRSLAILLLAIIAGCAANDAAPKRPLLPRSEPGSIVLRNDTDEPLFDVTLRGGRSNRLARISGVPPRANEYVTRPADAPPLPATVDVTWRDIRGRDHAERVSLHAVQSTSHPTDSTLVLRIVPDGSVVASVEPSSP